MKVKHTFILLFTSLVFIGALSCSSENDELDYKQGIVGNWTLVNKNGVGGEIEPAVAGTEYHFTSDNKIIIYQCYAIPVEGIYSIEGNHLTYSLGDVLSVYGPYKVEINDNALIISEQYESDIRYFQAPLYMKFTRIIESPVIDQ